MQPEYIFVLGSCIEIEVARLYNWFKSYSSLPTDYSKAVPLLQFFFVCTSVVSYVTFALSIFFPYFSFLLVPQGGCAS